MFGVSKIFLERN